jgi:hypothetical protein
LAKIRAALPPYGIERRTQTQANGGWRGLPRALVPATIPAVTCSIRSQSRCVCCSTGDAAPLYRSARGSRQRRSAPQGDEGRPNACSAPGTSYSVLRGVWLGSRTEVQSNLGEKVLSELHKLGFDVRREAVSSHRRFSTSDGHSSARTWCGPPGAGLSPDPASPDGLRWGGRDAAGGAT